MLDSDDRMRRDYGIVLQDHLSTDGPGTTSSEIVLSFPAGDGAGRTRRPRVRNRETVRG